MRGFAADRDATEHLWNEFPIVSELSRGISGLVLLVRPKKGISLLARPLGQDYRFIRNDCFNHDRARVLEPPWIFVRVSRSRIDVQPRCLRRARRVIHLYKSRPHFRFFAAPLAKILTGPAQYVARHGTAQ